MQWCPVAKHGDPLKKGTRDWSKNGIGGRVVRAIKNGYTGMIYIYILYIMYVLHVFFMFFFKAQHPESMNIHQYPEVCMLWTSHIVPYYLLVYVYPLEI